MFMKATRRELSLRTVTALLAAIVVAGTLATLAVRARAADTVSDAVYVCRPTASGETANAKMTAGSSVSLACHLVSMRLKMSDGSLVTIGRVSANARPGPDISKGLTPQQVNDAWVKWLDDMFHVTHTP